MEYSSLQPNEVFLNRKQFLAIAKSIEAMCENSDKNLLAQYYVYDDYDKEMYFENIKGLFPWLENHFQEEFNSDFSDDLRCCHNYPFKIVLLVEVDGADDKIYIASHNGEIECEEQKDMYEENNTNHLLI